MDFGKRETAPKKTEESTDLEKVTYALEHLSDEGIKARNDIYELGIDDEEFTHRIRVFNNLPASDRGAGNYDHSRTLEERQETKSIEQNTTIGKHRVTIVLSPDGEVLYSVSPDA